MQGCLHARIRCGRRLIVLAAAVLLAAGAVSCGKRQASWDELNDSAMQALSAGRSIEAEDHLLEALKLAREDEKLAYRIPLSLHRLARFYEARQRYSVAADYYAQALEADSKRLKVTDPELYDTVKRLAAMREISEQATEAKEVYKRFLALQEIGRAHV